MWRTLACRWAGVEKPSLPVLGLFVGGNPPVRSPHRMAGSFFVESGAVDCCGCGAGAWTKEGWLRMEAQFGPEA